MSSWALRSAPASPGLLKRSRGCREFFHMPELYPPETAAAFLALKKEQTRERLAEFLEQFVDVPVEADLALLELKEASWEEILIWIDSYIAQRPYLERKVGELVVKQREGFSNPGARELERSAEMSSPNVPFVICSAEVCCRVQRTFPAHGRTRRGPSANSRWARACRTISGTT